MGLESIDKAKNLMRDKHIWYALSLTTGAVILAYSSRLIYSQVIKPRRNPLIALRRKINQAESSPDHSKAIVDLDTTEKHIVFVDHPLMSITFTYLYLAKMKKKPTKDDAKKQDDPFMPPYRPGKFITNFSDTHAILFNTYSIVKNHVLVVTRHFEHQTSRVNKSDFAAIFMVRRALEGFVFYNSGPESGGSQPHKHFQAMPFDAGKKHDSHDVAELISQEASQVESPEKTFKCSLFKFVHIIKVLPSFEDNHDYEQIGETLEGIYNELLEKLNIDPQITSYNLILTENWMLIIKRRREKAFDVRSMNAIAFLGMFIMKEKGQLEFMQGKKPLEILEDMAFPDE